jgi:hypothetical protein
MRVRTRMGRALAVWHMLLGMLLGGVGGSMGPLLQVLKHSATPEQLPPVQLLCGQQQRV